MNSELEKLIEKYRITVNGLADLESDYDKVIKERGFVTLNGLLVESDASHNTDGAPAANTEENTSVSPTPSEPTTESDASHSEPTPVVPAPSDPVENSSVAPAVPAAPTPSEPTTEQPGVTPVVEGPVSNDTNLGTEVASGEGSNEPNPSRERSAEEEDSSEEDSASTEDSTTGRKPKKKKN